MYDDVTATLIPTSAEVIGYYVNGLYANGTQIAKLFPKARLVGITVTASAKADVLDVETGDATIAQIYGWLKAYPKSDATTLPVIYINAGNVQLMMATMKANGFKQGTDYLIWSAHYTGSAHICGPKTCGATGPYAVNGTQWTDAADNRSLDESEIEATFIKSLPAATTTAAPVTRTLTIDGIKVTLETGKSYTIEVD